MFYKLRQVFNTLCKTQLVFYSNSLFHQVDNQKVKKDESTSEEIKQSIKPIHQKGPVTIAWPNKSDTSGGISFQLKPLYDILEREDVRNCPVVICSVNGNTRKGKSFFLNQGVKYLKYQQEKLSNPNDHFWIHQDLNPCFEWSSQMSSVTDGISIWPEPFFCYDSHGKKKLCVILMDIQGLSRKKNHLNEENKLFAFSSLISSLFIFFNSSEGRHCLESLNDFCEFSKGIENDERPETTELPYKFGNLLIRLTDFTWPEFPLEEGCCFYNEHNTAKRKQSEDLYNNYFRTKTDDEAFKKKVEQLVRLFDNITIATTSPFGMNRPTTLHPPKVGEGESWEPKFLNGLIKFVETVFSMEFLETKTKKHLGKEIMGANLVPIIKSWENRIPMKEYNFKEEPKIARQADSYFTKLIGKNVDFYNAELNAFKLNSINDDLISFHENTKKQIRENFGTSDRFYNAYAGTYWQQLEMKLDERLLSEWKDVKAKRDKKAWTTNILAAAGTAAANLGVMWTGEPITTAVVVGISSVLAVVGGGYLLYQKWGEKREKGYMDTLSTRIKNQQKEN